MFACGSREACLSFVVFALRWLVKLSQRFAVVISCLSVKSSAGSFSLKHCTTAWLWTMFQTAHPKCSCALEHFARSVLKSHKLLPWASGGDFLGRGNSGYFLGWPKKFLQRGGKSGEISFYPLRKWENNLLLRKFWCENVKFQNPWRIVPPPSDAHGDSVAHWFEGADVPAHKCRCSALDNFLSLTGQVCYSVSDRSERFSRK